MEIWRYFLFSKGGHQSRLRTCNRPFGMGWHLQKWLCECCQGNHFGSGAGLLNQGWSRETCFRHYCCQFKNRAGNEVLGNVNLSPSIILNPERLHDFHGFPIWVESSILLAVGALIAINPTDPRGVQLFPGHLECCCDHLWVGHWSGAFQGTGGFSGGWGWVVFKVKGTLTLPF